jgi:predicted PurR-regulated permease PerM
MRRARADHSTAVLVTYFATLVAGAVLWIVAAPTLAGQVRTSITNLPAQVDVAGQRAVEAERVVNASLDEHAVPVRVDVASRLSLDNLARLLRVQLDSATASPLSVASAAFGILGNLGTMLLLSVFFLLGGEQLAERVARAFPTRAAPDARFVFSTVHDAFENYVRASLLEGILLGAGVWACLAAVHVDTAPLVGFAAGVLLLVPLLGAALAVLVPVVATLLWNPTATLIVAVALVLLEQLVLNVLGPRLMSKQLGLPPLLVFFGVLAGGQVAGVWGAVFGIPVLAALLACVEHFRSRW